MPAHLGLAELDGVRRVDVDVLGNWLAVVGHADRLKEAAVRAKVEALSYRLTPRKPLLSAGGDRDELRRDQAHAVLPR
jgi:hypothetical protein